MHLVEAGRVVGPRLGCALAIGVLLGATCMADDGGKARNGDARRIDDAVRWVTELGENARTYFRSPRRSATRPATQPGSLAAMPTQVHGTQGADLGNALIYYRAVSAWLASDEKAFSDALRKARKAGVFQPDLLRYQALVIGEGGGSKAARRVAARDEYGRIVPISISGAGRNQKLAFDRLTITIDPAPPSVPKLHGIDDRLVKIGDLYADSRLYEQAVDAYVESVFARSPRPRGAMGAAWLKVGKIEARLGRAQLAIQAYLKAVYCDASLHKEVRKGIAGVFARKGLAGKQHTGKKLSAKSAAKIAELYRQCNLHPFALRVLSEAEVASGPKLGEQRQSIEKEWRQIVDKHRQVFGDKCRLLGVKVADVKSWADAAILRPSDTYWKPRTDDEKPVRPLQKLRPEDAGARKAAKKQIIKEYTDTVRGLEGIVKDCLRGDYRKDMANRGRKGKRLPADYHAAASAMELLGELRSASSVGLLAEHIGFTIRLHQLVTWKMPTLADYPAAEALAKIGVPSLPAVLKAYARDPKGTRFQTLQIIRKVLGKECGKQYLKERLAEAKDPDRQRALTELLEALSA